MWKAYYTIIAAMTKAGSQYTQPLTLMRHGRNAVARIGLIQVYSCVKWCDHPPHAEWCICVHVLWTRLAADTPKSIIIIITDYEVMYEPLMTFGDALSITIVKTTNMYITLDGLQEFVNYNISDKNWYTYGRGGGVSRWQGHSFAGCLLKRFSLKGVRSQDDGLFVISSQSILPTTGASLNPWPARRGRYVCTRTII